MAEYTLTAEPPLAGTDVTIGGSRLFAPSALSIVSLALPLGEEKAASKAIKSAYKVDFPENGRSVVAKDGERFVRTAPDQAFVLFTGSGISPENHVLEKLKGTAYVTDQTDVWVALRIEGDGCRAALERVCPIDLHPDIFGVDDVARTVMEHLGTIIVRTGPNDFLLLSASSSARSFLHMLETSMRNVG